LTEVPEHLLRRSRERRAAATGEGAPAGEAPAPSSGAVEPAAAAAPATAAGGAAPPAARGAAAAPPAAAERSGPPAPPPLRQRVPLWAMPVLVALPLWAILYSGAFGERKSGQANDPVTIGQTVFATAGCSGCHGPTGGGGVGPALASVTKTFPSFDDHVAWVTNGSASVKGQPYGATGKVATGGMPGFGSQLSKAQIIAVVCHERVDYGKESPVNPKCLPGAAAAAAGSPGSGTK